MTTTSGKNVSVPITVEIHPNSELPRNVIGMKYVENKNDAVGNQLIGADGIEIPVGSTSDGKDAPPGTSSGGLAPPDSMTVISQSVYTDLFGNTLVDVVLEVHTPGTGILSVDHVVSLA